jgi:hypothetical protein
MKGSNSRGLAPVPRQTSVFGPERTYVREEPIRYRTRRRTALWLVPLLLVTAGLVGAVAVRYWNPAPAPRVSLGQVIKDITFENGSLTDGVAGATKVNRGVLLERTGLMKGLYAARVVEGASYLEEGLPDTTDLFLSFYVRLSELPASGDLRLVRFSTDGETAANLLLRDGRLRLRMDRRSIGADSDLLVPGRVYRVGIHQRVGTGMDAVVEAFVASGDDPFVAPFAATRRGEWTEPPDRVRVGMTTSNAVEALIDDVRLHADEMPAPSE